MEDLRQRGLRLADEIDSDEESDDEESPDETFEDGIQGDLQLHREGGRLFFNRKLAQRRKREGPRAVGVSIGQELHQRVSKWTQNVDIFTKDFLLEAGKMHFEWAAISRKISAQNPKVGKKVHVSG